MWYAITWVVVFSLLALWSLAAWALHALAAWAVANAGSLTTAAAGAVGLQLPAWLAAWMPPQVNQAIGLLMVGLVSAVEALLQVTPELAGGLSVVTWVIWGIGSGLLLLLGAGVHVLIALMRRRSDAPGPEPRQPMAA